MKVGILGSGDVAKTLGDGFLKHADMGKAEAARAIEPLYMGRNGIHTYMREEGATHEKDRRIDRRSG